MRLPGISSLATTSAIQDGLRTTQLQLEKAQKEVSTGRHADVGLSLSFNVSRNLDWRLHLLSVEHSLESNGLAAARTEATQSSLDAARSIASEFMNSLVGARGSQNGQNLIKQSAYYAIDSIRDAINVNYAGQYLFGGQNNAELPLTSYKGGPAEQSFDVAFQAEFGFAKTDPAARQIAPAQMRSFLDGNYDNLFGSGLWQSNWSKATAQNIEARVDGNSMIDTSANTDELPFKDLMKGMVAVMDAGTGQLSQSTFQSVVDYALTKVGTAIQGFGEIEARVGNGQHAISQANEKLSSKKALLHAEIRRTEGIDQADAVVRMNSLMTQMESNYAVTGKISRLSLLNYL
jgi:flagellar hook-associated protein 3 FlgL